MDHSDPIDVLIVDDNDDDIIMIREAIDEAGTINVVHVAMDGQEALKFLRKEGKYVDAPTPKLVMLDINMPKKNGFEVLRDIKADPSLRHIPVAMLTTSTREEDVIQSYAEGACSYIPKPVDFDQLREVVKQFGLYWGLIAKVPGKE